ncbi:MAG: hypothetical protein COA42_18345 [Alteromonadaceae bacterium]|nr:MAG: hypothetical protein COA42_18345 [Alteromonadaceae bacterium]
MDFDDWEEMKCRETIKNQTLDGMGESLTPEYLAGLDALFYFARYLDFSEGYKVMYNSKLHDVVSSSSGREEIARDFLHIFSKSNLIDNLLKSLYFLNAINLAETIVKLYDLEDVFDFLSDARNKRDFVKTEICGFGVATSALPPILSHPHT